MSTKEYIYCLNENNMIYLRNKSKYYLQLLNEINKYNNNYNNINNNNNKSLINNNNSNNNNNNELLLLISINFENKLLLLANNNQSIEIEDELSNNNQFIETIDNNNNQSKQSNNQSKQTLISNNNQYKQTFDKQNNNEMSLLTTYHILNKTHKSIIIIIYQKIYEILKLITFYTFNENELSSWLIRYGRTLYSSSFIVDINIQRFVLID